MGEGKTVVAFGKEGGSSYRKGAQGGFWIPEMFYFTRLSNGFAGVCWVVFHEAEHIWLFLLC